MALSAKANTRSKNVNPRDVPLKSGYKVYQGAIVVVDTANGYGRPAFTGTGLVAAGVAQKTVDNTSTGTLPGANTDGGLTVPVKSGEIYGPFASAAAPNAVTDAMRGQICYLVDDNTVTASSSGASPAGIVDSVDSDGVWVQINPDGRQS